MGAVIASVGTLLVVAASAEGRFVAVATHPQAAAQPTKTGRILATLEPFGGKLYVGYGDYSWNTGPISITPWTGSAFGATEFVADTEAIYTFRQIGGLLYVPSIDPRGFSADYVVGSPWSSASPVGAAHAFDMATLTGSDLWICGASYNGNASVWRSLDGGASWALSLTVPPLGAFQTGRFYGCAVYNGRLYVQAYSHPSGAHPTSKVFDGRSWSDGPDLAMGASLSHARVFAGKLVFMTQFHPGILAGAMRSFDGTTALNIGPTTVYDFAINAGTLYALGSDGWVRTTTDLVNWTAIGKVGRKARSVAVFNGAVYVGGTDSKLYRGP
jgi:hypothetical protein